MSGYSDANLVGSQGMEILMPYLEERSTGLVLIRKGTLGRWLQESMGDAVVNTRQEETVSVEVKTEKRHTGNLFLETWSNRNLDVRDNYYKHEQNTGWLYKLRSTLLLYYFIDTDDLYSLDLFHLKRWAFGYVNKAGEYRSGNLYKYVETRQSAHRQLNDTWGRLVPIRVLQIELGCAMKTTKVKQRSLLDDMTITAVVQASGVAPHVH